MGRYMDGLMSIFLVPSFLSSLLNYMLCSVFQNSGNSSFFFSQRAAAYQVLSAIRQQWLNFSPDLLLSINIFMMFSLAMFSSTISFLPFLFFISLLSFPLTVTLFHTCVFYLFLLLSCLFCLFLLSPYPQPIPSFPLIVTSLFPLYSTLTHFECLPSVSSAFIPSPHYCSSIFPFKTR